MSHILVVDDDPAIRDVVVDILELSEYDVKTACNGAEAFQKICSEQPAMVLLDLMMPVMDGWEFLRRCRQHAPCSSIPVAIMSAAHDTESVAADLGAQGYLRKPFDIDAVLAVIGRLTARATLGEGGALN